MARIAQTTDAKTILARLAAESSAANRAGMARFGVAVDRAYGVPVSRLREMVREIRREVSRPSGDRW
jgi:hypothetical protein